MKAGLWGYWLVALGIFVLAVMMLLQSFTTTNTEDYYLIKEVTEAAMVDAIDYAHYRVNGEVKINREKFIENFIRRFSESVSPRGTYNIDFYDIYETPPKVSVRVATKSETLNFAGDAENLDVVNRIDAILEFTNNVE